MINKHLNLFMLVSIAVFSVNASDEVETPEPAGDALAELAALIDRAEKTHAQDAKTNAGSSKTRTALLSLAGVIAASLALITGKRVHKEREAARAEAARVEEAAREVFTAEDGDRVVSLTFREEVAAIEAAAARAEAASMPLTQSPSEGEAGALVVAQRPHDQRRHDQRRVVCIRPHDLQTLTAHIPQEDLRRLLSKVRIEFVSTPACALTVGTALNDPSKDPRQTSTMVELTPEAAAVAMPLPASPLAEVAAGAFPEAAREAAVARVAAAEARVEELQKELNILRDNPPSVRMDDGTYANIVNSTELLSLRKKLFDAKKALKKLKKSVKA